MALPWTVACLLDWRALRWFFRADLTPNSETGVEVPAAPRYALMILTGTIAGFVITSAIDAPPAWAAWLGVVALAIPALKGSRRHGGGWSTRQAPGSCSSSWRWA